MEPICKITDQEKSQFISAVNFFADDHTQTNHYLKVDDYNYILRLWNEEKSKYLFKLLGEKLIISKSVKYEKPLEEIEEEMVKINSPFLYDFREKVILNTFCQECELNDGIGYPVQWAINALLNCRALATNVYGDATFYLISPKTGKPFKIQNGCKTLKALGKISEEFDLESYEDFRLKHSRILNNRMTYGTLHLSIHPNDYATMSDNNYGWDSCMSWETPGGYCQGTVEMMNSPCVLVAYITGDNKDFYFGGEKWTNKKWRELFIVDPKAIIEICPYPHTHRDSESITKSILEWIKELAVKNLEWDFYGKSQMTEWEDGSVINPYDNQEMYIDFSSGAMYNDFRFKHYCFLPCENSKNTNIYYSGKAECLNCGEANDDWSCIFDNEGSIIGECCDNSWYCSYCGDRHSDYDPYYINGNAVCEHCYDNYVISCDHCGRADFEENFEYLHFGDSKKGLIYFDIGPLNFCDKKCAKEYLKNKLKENSNLYTMEYFWKNYLVVDVNDIKDDYVEPLMGITLEERNDLAYGSYGSEEVRIIDFS